MWPKTTPQNSPFADHIWTKTTPFGVFFLHRCANFTPYASGYASVFTAYLSRKIAISDKICILHTYFNTLPPLPPPQGYGVSPLYPLSSLFY